MRCPQKFYYFFINKCIINFYIIIHVSILKSLPNDLGSIPTNIFLVCRAHDKQREQIGE